MNWKEVRPALRFLGVFLASYIFLSLAYGLWIESLGDIPDPMTREVSREVVDILKTIGYQANLEQNPSGPTMFLFNGTQKVLNVFEGCNGLNVMIVFVSFVLAFGGVPKRMLLFVFMGLMVIHLANLARILWLFWLSAVDAKLFYYFHKYLFTAVIYVIVFVLWWLWVTRWNGSTQETDAKS